MEIKKNPTDDCVNLDLCGDFIIGNAEPLKEDLLKSIEQGDKFKLSFSGLTAIDLVGCQHIMALQKYCGITKKELTFADDFTEEIQDVLKIAGILESFQNPEKED